MNKKVSELATIATHKKTWTSPSLAMLDVRATKADEPLWEFTSEGEFWKRQQLMVIES